VLLRERLTAKGANRTSNLRQLFDAFLQVLHACPQFAIFQVKGFLPGLKGSQQTFQVSRVVNLLGEGRNHLTNILPLLFKGAGICC